MDLQNYELTGVKKILTKHLVIAANAFCYSDKYCVFVAVTKPFFPRSAGPGSQAKGILEITPSFGKAQ